MALRGLSGPIAFMLSGGALIAASGCAHGGAAHGLDRMVESERAFCRLARETSVKQAFLRYLGDDAVMLVPRPANGKHHYAARRASDAGLAWQPSFARISAAGDLGYTFGPWQYRTHRDQDTADEYGHFVSVWQRQTDGQWRLAFDSGISHPRPQTAPDTLRASIAGNGGATVPLSANELLTLADSLLAIDRGLGDTASAAISQQRLAAAFGTDASLFEESHFPVSGNVAIRTHLQAAGSAFQWMPQRAIVAASGDLGYVYGTARSLSPGKPASEIGYLRIWEKAPGGAWRIVVQKTNPVTD